MPSFADSIFLFVLALLLFGPKKLPVLARELGKWVGEFRRASNEFKMQMEEELRLSEQADRQKQIAAMEAAAPIPPPLNDPAEPEHLPYPAAVPDPETAAAMAQAVSLEEAAAGNTPQPTNLGAPPAPTVSPSANVGSTDESTPTGDSTRPIPIATSGELQMMPPATGLPLPRGRNGDSGHSADPLGGLLNSIPEADNAPAFAQAAHPSSAHLVPEPTAHGD